jgi:hypothetical protein
MSTVESRLRFAAGTIALGGLYITASAGIIAMNKWLMTPGHFPHAASLTSLHMMTCTGVTVAGTQIVPSAFPTLKQLQEKKETYARSFAPLALFFAASLILCNSAYLYAGVGFLQMMKQAKVIITYTFSVLAALEVFQKQRAAIILIVCMGVGMTVNGAISYTFRGILLQAGGQIAECLKVVLTNYLLSSPGMKLDVMTFLMGMSGFCLLPLGLYALMFEVDQQVFTDAQGVWPVLLVNCALAFSLNVIVSAFIQRTSGVAYLLCGITKDGVLVLAAYLFFAEPVTRMQVVGFTVASTGVFLYSATRMFPELFTYAGMREFVNTRLKKAVVEKEQDEEEGVVLVGRRRQ